MKTTLLICLVMLVGFVSCSKDEDPAKTNVTVIFKSSDTTTGTKSALVGDTLEISSLMINIREIEFEFDDDQFEDEEVEDSSISEIELQGPFVIDLVADGVLLQEKLGSYNLPNAAYEEIEFELSRETLVGNDHPMYGRSMFIAGTVDGYPFEIWHTANTEVEIEFPDSTSFVLSGDNFKLFIDMHVDMIVEGIKQLNLNGEFDGNKNGIIEIGPDDEDGNNSLANEIRDILKDSFDLDDDDDNENDDD